MVSMKKIMTTFFLAFSLAACETVLFEDDPASDPVANFDALWQEIDEGYAFFEFKNMPAMKHSPQMLDCRRNSSIYPRYIRMSRNGPSYCRCC